MFVCETSIGYRGIYCESEVEMTPIELVQGQLEAYNNRDIEEFCKYFATDVKVYDGRSGALSMEGMEVFRERYSESFSLPDLHCTIVNRMVQDDIVIDQESVVFQKEEPVVHAIAVYRIEGEKIQEIRFY